MNTALKTGGGGEASGCGVRRDQTMLPKQCDSHKHVKMWFNDGAFVEARTPFTAHVVGLFLG